LPCYCDCFVHRGLERFHGKQTLLGNFHLKRTQEKHLWPEEASDWESRLRGTEQFESAPCTPHATNTKAQEFSPTRKVDRTHLANISFWSNLFGLGEKKMPPPPPYQVNYKRQATDRERWFIPITYSGGRDWKDHGSRHPGKKLPRPHLNK
jgi:hypothetical protein